MGTVQEIRPGCKSALSERFTALLPRMLAAIELEWRSLRRMNAPELFADTPEQVCLRRAHAALGRLANSVSEAES